MQKRKPWGSVKKLADELGVNRVYLSAILAGSAFPSVRLAQKIAKKTGKSFLDYRPDLRKLFKESL
jgi:transcriptional regulator with XRE-family HTH domain